MGAEPPVLASGAPPSGPDEPRELLIALDGLHCAACVARLHREVAGRVAGCEVDLGTRVATFSRRSGDLSESALIGLLRNAGFQPQRLASAEIEVPERQARRRGVARVGIAIIGAMQVMMFAWPGYFDVVDDPGIQGLLRWAQLLVATPTVFWAGWPFFANAARALRAGSLSMDVPVALSLAIAWAGSTYRTLDGQGLLYFDTATMFVALLLLGRHLEAATRAQAVERLRALADSTPACALRVLGETLETVPTAELRIGDRVRVMPGEVVAADGLLESDAELDEALLSGESTPVLRRVGEKALAGSLNLGTRAITLVVSARPGDTRIAGILRLLLRASLRKPAIQQLADRIAARFTLAVILIALLGAGLALHRGADAAIGVAIAVMVASCPCALSLAVPAALAAASSRLAARGVLVARTDRLLRLAEVDTVLVDKTGTLTHAALRIEQVLPVAGMTAQAALAIGATLEAGLAHPIAQAFAAYDDGGVATGLQVEPGQGVRGSVEGCNYCLGPASTALTQQHPALTWITLADDRGDLAHFGLSAIPRADAAEVMRHLRECGLHVELLTGDSADAADALARRAGISAFAARQSPEDKLNRLRVLQSQGRIVLAVGDGLNDAPFLAAADVSAAMPKGAAAAQSRADLVLVNERLDGLLLARTMALQARRRVRENLAWAAAYNLLVLPLAFFAELPPALAAAGMSLSSLLVVGNALRLRLPAPSSATTSLDDAMEPG